MADKGSGAMCDDLEGKRRRLDHQISRLFRAEGKVPAKSRPLRACSQDSGSRPSG